MKTAKSWVVISLVSLFIANADASESMCLGGENAIFNCDFGTSAASLCISRTSGLFVYRKGTPKKLELVLNERRYGRGTLFLLSNTQYAGGYESHIRFLNRGVTYILYDKSLKTDDGPEVLAGIIAYENGQELVNMVCEKGASFSAEAYEAMRTDDYQPIQAK